MSPFALAAQPKTAMDTNRGKSTSVAQANSSSEQTGTLNQGPPTKSAQVDVPPGKNSEINEEQDSQRLANYTWWLTAFTGLLAFVSMGQGFFLYRQARQLKEHAEHFRILASAATSNATAAQDAAGAALRQAGILANAERAWVVETIVFPDHIPRRSVNWNGGVITARLTLKNIGRQPARLQSVQSRFHVAELLSKEPQYSGGGLVPDGYLLAPGEERHWRCVLDEGSLDDELIDRIERGSTLHLYLYGRRSVFPCLALEVHQTLAHASGDMLGKKAVHRRALGHGIARELVAKVVEGEFEPVAHTRRDAQQMKALFRDLPEAIANTQIVSTREARPTMRSVLRARERAARSSCARKISPPSAGTEKLRDDEDAGRPLD